MLLGRLHFSQAAVRPVCLVGALSISIFPRPSPSRKFLHASYCCTAVDFHQRCRALSVVGREAHACLGFLLRIWLFAQLLDPKHINSAQPQSHTDPHLRLCTLPFWCAPKLSALSKNFAHSMQYHWPRPGRSSTGVASLCWARCFSSCRSAWIWSRSRVWRRVFDLESCPRIAGIVAVSGAVGRIRGRRQWVGS
jgi:hypothetical protein